MHRRLALILAVSVYLSAAVSGCATTGPEETLQAAPATPKRKGPPRRWQFQGVRPDGTHTPMGAVGWFGGRDVRVVMFGTMKYILEQRLQQVIEERPEDPGGAIDDELKRQTEEFGGDMSFVEVDPT